jgi:hypothetical protein
MGSMIFEEIEKGDKEIGYEEEDDEVEHHISPTLLYQRLA